MPAPPKQSPIRAALFMIAASLFIAVSTFLAKGVAGRFESLGTATGIHPLQITAWRFVVACAFWTIFISIRRVPFTTVHWPLHITRTLFGWATVTCLFWASSMMALADATAISFLMPVFILMFAALLLGERAGPVRWGAVSVMLIGALILLRPGTSAFQPIALVALLAAVTGASESLLIKRLISREPRVQILFINNSIGAVIALLASAWLWIWPAPGQAVVLVTVGLSMTAAQVLFLTSMRDGDASYVTPFVYSTLIFAGTLDWLVFGDRPDLVGALGALTIVGGAVFLALRDGRRATK